MSRLRAISKTAVRALGMRDVGRIDFRVGEDGRIYLLEVNALPSLEPGASLFAAAAREGLDYGETLHAIVESAAAAPGAGRQAGRAADGAAADPLRIGFTYNVKRVDPKAGNDAEAEYDAPETIDAIREALERYGHVVAARGRRRAAAPARCRRRSIWCSTSPRGSRAATARRRCPALCELLGIPYTGSDSATLSIALDKALAKRVLAAARDPDRRVPGDGDRPRAPVVEAEVPADRQAERGGLVEGRQRVGLVVDDEEALRAVVRELIDRYRQPALVEEYIPGASSRSACWATGGRACCRRWRSCSRTSRNARPVYDFQIKQEWEKHVYYECPAKLTPAELKAVERVCRETFAALDCRDVARVDLRMTPKGEIYVLEVNPLPGLTPGYSDLCLIAKAAGIEYRTLIGEILAGGLKRLREKRREAKSEAAARPSEPEQRAPTPSRAAADRQRQRPNGGRNGSGRGTATPAPADREPTASIPSAGMSGRLRDLGFSVGRFPAGPLNAITDVAGVRVGHTTLIIGEGPLERRQGPGAHRRHRHRPARRTSSRTACSAGGFVLNGAGEVSGLTQVLEWGLLETPILLTNTMAVGKVSDAAVKWMTQQVARHRRRGRRHHPAGRRVRRLAG